MSAGRPAIRMSFPDITEEEIRRVVDVLRSGQLSLGPQQEEFEEQFADYVGVRNAVAVSSGTAGLHLALLGLGIGPGDVVITSPFSFVASVNAILYTGAIPLFVDVDDMTGNIDTNAVETLVRSLHHGNDVPAHAKRVFHRRNQQSTPARCVLPIHVFGQLADTKHLSSFADEYDLKILEDACEALGATDGQKHAGTRGHAGVFAFYPNKQMTTGEGGMVVTDDDHLAELSRSMRNQGRDTFDKWLNHSRLGFNYRLDEMSAALGVGQLARIDELLARRGRVAAWYNERLLSLAGVRIVGRVGRENERRSWFVYVIQLADANTRAHVMRRLEEQGVPSRPYFTPLHTQRHVCDSLGYVDEDFPVATRLGEISLALPFSSVTREDEVDYVATALERALRPAGL